MLVTKTYDRMHTVDYAVRWAMERNPLFYDYTNDGGDCTNFVSQCVFAGSCEMNFTQVYGWYYSSPTDRTASWTGVPYFYDFITKNHYEGPFGHEVNAGQCELGDIIQLGTRSGKYYHALVITGFSQGTYLVTAHTDDALNRKLTTYSYGRARYIHIEGVRFEMPLTNHCFDDLINGTKIH